VAARDVAVRRLTLSWFAEHGGRKRSSDDVMTRDQDPAAGPLRGLAMGTTYESVSDLAQALRRAAEAHGRHEERTGEADPDWPDWYALYMVRERAGDELPT
jgi:hypothetical protein